MLFLFLLFLRCKSKLFIMKFIFENLTPALSLNEALEYLTKNYIARYKDITIFYPDCSDWLLDSGLDSGLVLLYKQVVLFIPVSKVKLVLKRLHYFVHHKWMYKDDVVGFVNLLHL